jgi:hypothetical protein
MGVNVELGDDLEKKVPRGFKGKSGEVTRRAQGGFHPGEVRSVCAGAGGTACPDAVLSRLGTAGSTLQASMPHSRQRKRKVDADVPAAS